MRTKTAIREYTQHLQGRCLNPDTIHWQETLLERFTDWLSVQKRSGLAAVTSSMMLSYQLHVSQLLNRNGEPYDPRVQNAHITAVRKLFRFLQLTGRVTADPTTGIQLARVPNVLPKSVLSRAEVRRLLAQPDAEDPLGIRNRAILEVLYSTAIRRSELTGLDLADLHPDEGTMFVRQGKYCKDRVVPCGRAGWRWLKRYLRNARPGLVEDPEDPAVFVNFRGRRLGKQGVKWIVDTCSQKAGIKRRVTPHSFRHACATHMSENGADITCLQSLLGHARADTTSIYIRVAITHLKQVHARCHPRERG